MDEEKIDSRSAPDLNGHNRAGGVRKHHNWEAILRESPFASEFGNLVRSCFDVIRSSSGFGIVPKKGTREAWNRWWDRWENEGLTQNKKEEVGGEGNEIHAK